MQISNTLRSMLLQTLAALPAAFNSISGEVARLRDYVEQLILTFIKLAANIPPVFVPGSPTPFEMGLRGIASALQDVTIVGNLSPVAATAGGGNMAGFSPRGGERAKRSSRDEELIGLMRGLPDAIALAVRDEMLRRPRP